MGFPTTRLSLAIAPLLLALACDGNVMAQQLPKGRTEASIEAVKVLEEKLYKAVVEKDTRTLAGLLTDDFIRTPPTTPTTTKAQWIAQVDSGEVRYVSIKRQDVKYRVFGDTVLVHAVTNIRGHTSSRDVDLVLRLLNVWVRQNGEWRLAAVQGNEMPKN